MNKNKKHEMDCRRATEIRRRDFLSASLGSAGLLVPGVVMASRGRCPQRSKNSPDSGCITIGFCPGSSALPSLDPITHATESSLVDSRDEPVAPERLRGENVRHQLLDPAALNSGERAFAGGDVRMRIHGAFTVGAARAEALAIYAHPQPFHDVAFHAWSVATTPAAAPSGPTEFRLGVDGAAGITLSFDVGEPEDDGDADDALTPLQPEFYRRHVFAHFDAGGTRGQPKLRRGLYLIAWGKDPARLPRWTDYDIEIGEETGVAGTDSVATDAAMLLSRLARRRGGESPGFQYVLLSVDAEPSGRTLEGGA